LATIEARFLTALISLLSAYHHPFTSVEELR